MKKTFKNPAVDIAKMDVIELNIINAPPIMVRVYFATSALATNPTLTLAMHAAM